jgi:HK97 family phage major capsid protein
MKTSSQLKAELFEKNATIEAIVAVAKEEKRELTAEEQAAFNAFHGLDDEDGEFGKLQSAIKQAEKIEARQKEIIAAARGKVTDTPDVPTGADGGQKPKAIVVPARAKRHGILKAYKGERASEDAYVAGQVFAAHLLGSDNSKKWLDDHGITASLSTGDNDKGGIFVPAETETSIIRLVEEFGVFRSGASLQPMGSDRITVPVRVSGMVAYPVAETTTANQSSNTGTASDPKWKNIELVARKWKVITRMSDELNEDSLIQMADQLTLEMALAFAIAEDQSGFLGDGTSAYHGIKGLAASLLAGSVHTALAGNTAFSTLDAEDFETLVGKLPDYPGINPAWHVSKEGYYASMYRLKRASGGTTGMEMQTGYDAEFMGFPVIFNQVTNKVLTAQTSTRLLYFGDLAMAAKFGDRRGVTVSLSNEAHWEEDQIGIKATERFDINIHSTGTATEAGAIIALETPGS